MEKELKFKKEWFDVLNQCSRELRTDVMEAVFQYFFTGAEPSFTDDARRIAFGFIRADIDATRRRRQARQERKNKNAPQQEPINSNPPTYEEKEYLSSLILHWNNSIKNTNLAPIPLKELDSGLYIPILNALRRLPYQKIYDAVTRVRHNPAKPTYTQFFNNL